jgi:hypothetical protein
MKFRSFALPLLFSSLAATGIGCAEPDDSSPTTTNDENEIVNVTHTEVERQAIGNCWIYAHASWIESMNRTATGADFDVSQSYWTYWHWFDQLSSPYGTKIATGGSWQTANSIVQRYGLMAEKDFIFADSQGEMSNRQKLALDTLNASLQNGVLRDPAARRNKVTVRKEMDRAWGLSAEQSAMLDRVFGADVTKTFKGTASSTGTKIIRPQDFDVKYAPGPGRAPVAKKLSQAMTEWKEAYFWGEMNPQMKRELFTRVQKALHAAQPVVITWFVDFNAMENGQNERRGSFNMTTLNRLGPGSQGGHMTVLEDYEAELADGTLLKAGTTLDPNRSSDRALLDKALLPTTKIKFLRVKNSWGSARPDRAFAPGMPGYHDLYSDYLNGPIKRCALNAAGETDTSNCTTNHTPLQNVVLPPGF